MLTISKKWVITFGVIFTLILAILWTYPKPTHKGTIKIYDRNEILLFEYSGDIGHKEFVSLESVPEDLVNATIATEDNRFYKHNGVDLKGIARAAYVNIQNQSIQEGGSTITQQYARMVDDRLNNANRKSYIRKIREMMMAMWIDTFNSKNRILEGYLNEAYYGNKAYGVQAAARIYFDKDVKKLSLVESATIVATTANPSKYDPFTNHEKALARRDLVLKRMLDNGFISQSTYEESINEPLALSKSSTLPKLTIQAPHFVEYIHKKVIDLGKENNFNSNGGLKIYTTIDTNVNRYSEEIAQTTIEELKDKHNVSNAAVVIIDNKSNELLTMVGGINYDNPNGGQVNMATAHRQPGSAIKPITYAEALNQGYTAGSIIYDVPTEYQTKSGEGFIPNNYDGQYHGVVTVREALASSLNLPAVEMLNRIGIEAFLDTAKKMGITTFTRESEYDLAITLGGAEVTLYELTNAYATLARKGQYQEIKDIYKVENDKGETLYEHKSANPPIPLFDQNSKEIAYIISSILSDNNARSLGFGQRSILQLPKPTAVKTGTTTDWHDNWTVGYTPEYTVGVWVGNNNNAPMTNLTGVTGAAPIWNKVFQKLNTQFSSSEFRKPEGLIEVEICALTGQLPAPDCNNRYKELYIVGTEPSESIQIKEVLKDLPDSKSYPLPNKSDLRIISPKNNAIFETTAGLNSDEAIGIEILASENIANVTIIIDSSELTQLRNKPYIYFWEPIIGEHELTVVGYNYEGEEIARSTKYFTVLEYKSDITD